jgi:hypothetical protein
MYSLLLLQLSMPCSAEYACNISALRCTAPVSASTATHHLLLLLLLSFLRY